MFTGSNISGLDQLSNNSWRSSVKVGDLVREKGLQERTGVIVQVIQYSSLVDPQMIYKVLWSRHSPTLPTLTGPAWPDQLEVINESR